MKNTIEHTNHQDFLGAEDRAETTTPVQAGDATAPTQPRLPAYVAHF